MPWGWKKNITGEGDRKCKEKTNNSIFSLKHTLPLFLKQKLLTNKSYM